MATYYRRARGTAARATIIRWGSTTCTRSATTPSTGFGLRSPDLVASVILTGRIPKMVDAFRILPKGQLARSSAGRAARCRDDRSAPTRLLSHRDRRAQASCFQHLAFRRRTHRLDKSLKVLANATSYGIFAEMVREESTKKVPVTCYGVDAKRLNAEPSIPNIRASIAFRLWPH